MDKLRAISTAQLNQVCATSARNAIAVCCGGREPLCTLAIGVGDSGGGVRSTQRTSDWPRRTMHIDGAVRKTKPAPADR